MPRFAIAAPLLIVALGACRAAEPAPDPQPSAVASAPVAVAPPPARPAAADPHEITCTWPVDGKDTAASVLKRFGKDARRATLPGPEGAELDGVVLWDGDPARRIELVLDDDGKERVVGAMIRGKGSMWAVRSLRLGDGIAAVSARNGKPFSFYGFDWDYGGYVDDWGGGALEGEAKTCTLTLRLEPSGGTVPDALEGDSPVRSDNPAVAKARPVVSELSLNWP